ncbi:MAG TPA: restriction endonuclease subunit S [Candidatus Dojkabacteria bacterium]|nr:restriction endonuclease subunit S [Candidatus Dojkabacteria bacterium]
MNRPDTKTTLTPTLRFPEFSGEWEERKLGDLGSVKMCKRIFAHQTKEVGEVPFYKIGTLGSVADAFINKNLFKNYKLQYNFPRKGQTLITCSGTIGKCVQFDGRDSYYQDSNIVWIDNDNEVVDDDFLFLLLTNCRWDKLNSTTITRIYTNDLRSLKFEFPKSEEQRKIASFLTSVDDWIENLKKQKEAQEKYKKGMMQKIFSQEIRFKDEDGSDYPEWEEKRFNEILVSTSPKYFQIKSSEIIATGEYKVVDQGKSLIAGYSNNSNKVFESTPVIVFGDHTTILKYINFDFIIGADGTKILMAKSNEDNLKFLFYLLQSNQIKPEGYKRHFSILSKMIFSKPTLSEQQKIADFLSSIDDLINITNQRITQAEKWKKGVMQKMFI